MINSKASARWEGGLKNGTGTMKPAHAGDVPFTLGSRFEGQPSSNPEELIGAALAGCFSMALSASLEKAGYAPKTVKTDAVVTMEKQGEGFAITRIALDTEAAIPGITDAAFQPIANATKTGCPVSKALASVPITLNAKLTS
jgi:osmotically inducible protein OsmC